MKKLMHESWHFLLDNPQWNYNFKLLREHRTYANPSPKVILNPFTHPLDDVVVFIPQALPYSRHISNGYAYGTQRREMSASDAVLYTELFTDFVESKPFNYDLLTKEFKDIWGKRLAEQGVLLLPLKLAYIDGHEEDNLLNWEEVYYDIHDKLHNKEDLVWILIGNEMASTSVPSTHFSIKTARLSNTSAINSFLGSSVFTKTNSYLTHKGISPIEWVII